MLSAAYFAFRQWGGREFVFGVRSAEAIAHARRILSGEEREKVNVFGRIVFASRPYNPGWSYHLDPDSIQFFADAAENMVAGRLHTARHCGGVSGIILPGGYWFPSGSRVVRELHPHNVLAP